MKWDEIGWVEDEEERWDRMRMKMEGVEMGIERWMGQR